MRDHHGVVGSDLSDWLIAHADSLNRHAGMSEEVVPQLAQAGLFGIGVPAALGGSGGSVRDAALAIAEIAQYSLSAAFVFWGQRSFIEYLLQSPNRGLMQRWLPRLISGQHAGASGLSNAMKFLGGIESLQITAQPQAHGWQLQGQLQWITNLRKSGFVAAAASAVTDGKAPMVVIFESGMNGVERGPDLDLVALRGSNTAAVNLQHVPLSPAEVLHEDARQFLPSVRPAFLSMQCGMSIGLARASLTQALIVSESKRSVLEADIRAAQRELDHTVTQLLDGVDDQRFKTQAAPLFRLRIRLAEIVQQAVGLELQAKGGTAYLAPENNDFLRRWSEAAFIPIVTPSLSQLQTELQRHASLCVPAA